MLAHQGARDEASLHMLQDGSSVHSPWTSGNPFSETVQHPWTQSDAGAFGKIHELGVILPKFSTIMPSTQTPEADVGCFAIEDDEFKIRTSVITKLNILVPYDCIWLNPSEGEFREHVVLAFEFDDAPQLRDEIAPADFMRFLIEWSVFEQGDEDEDAKTERDEEDAQEKPYGLL